MYEIENDAVYEILKLEDDSKNNIYDYDSIFKLAMDRNMSELSKFIKGIKKSHKKAILKSPYVVGTKWDDGEIVDFNSEQQLQEIKDYQYKGKPVPDSDTLVVKYSDHYVFYKKGIGIIHYFYTNLKYPEVNDEIIFNVNDSEINSINQDNSTQQSKNEFSIISDKGYLSFREFDKNIDLTIHSRSTCRRKARDIR